MVFLNLSYKNTMVKLKVAFKIPRVFLFGKFQIARFILSPVAFAVYCYLG